MQGFIPSWIQPANEVGNLAHGYQIGLSIGAQQAERTFREQQMMRQQQLAAQDRAQWEAEFGLRAKQAADKAAAIKAYQSDIAGGMDPIQAIMKHGPSMQEPGAVQAAALRMQTQLNKPVLEPEIRNYALPSGGNVSALVDRMTGSSHVIQEAGATPPSVRPAVDEKGKEIPGMFMVPGKAGWSVQRVKQTGDESAKRKDEVYKAKRRDLGNSLMWESDPKKKADIQKEIEALDKDYLKSESASTQSKLKIISLTRE